MVASQNVGCFLRPRLTLNSVKLILEINKISLYHKEYYIIAFTNQYYIMAITNLLGIKPLFCCVHLWV